MQVDENIDTFPLWSSYLQLASVSPPAILDREHAIVVNLGNVKW
jgi:hypothetical protein